MLSNLFVRARIGLVAGLWAVVLVLLALLVRGLAWVAAWSYGVLLPCLRLADLVAAFSSLAAAVHLSADTMQGHYPYEASEPMRRGALRTPGAPPESDRE